jgi:hypothetical protein
MDNYLLEDVVELDATLVQDKTWLVVHKLHRTPYHIGLIYGTHYYALTVHGMETEPRAAVIEKLLDKTYNNLLVEINVPGKMTREEVNKLFGSQELNHQQFRSCLFPVREFMAHITGKTHYDQAGNLFDLLDLLKKDQLWEKKMATRMTAPMESKIVLMRYDQETIRKHIKRLQELNNRETHHK